MCYCNGTAAVEVRYGDDHAVSYSARGLRERLGVSTERACRSFARAGCVKSFARSSACRERRGALRTLFSRAYEEKVAVRDVDMDLEPGELVGYIGPNGAGKSTTIKMLTGILVPTSGTLEVAGIVPYRDRKRNARNIGVVFGQRSQLYWDLPLDRIVRIAARHLQHPARPLRAQPATRSRDILEMEPFLRTPVRQLSLGQRMRGDFAAALLHDPQIVYLDEPTIGLDVIAKEAIRDFVRHINEERGTTVILTTHDLADVERLCRRIIIIDSGTVIYDGGIERIKEAIRHAPHADPDVRAAAATIRS